MQNEPVKNIAYAELHCLSNFSFLRGASHPEELVLQAQALGYSAIAITDECSMAGIVRAYATIRSMRSAPLDAAAQPNHQAIKLIVGSEFQLSDGPLIVLLCPNRAAYAEVCALITLARRRCSKGEYLLHTHDLEDLKHALLLWQPGHHLRPGASAEYDIRFARFTQALFPRKTWIMYERILDAQESKSGRDYRRWCCRLSNDYHQPLLCAGNVHMHCRERQNVQDVLTAMRYSTDVESLGMQSFSNAERYLRPLSKLRKVYGQQDIAETIRVAELCQFELSSLRYEYPAELVPNGFTATAYLKYLVEKGIAERFPNGVSLPIQGTIRRELKLIQEQGYEYFFLTVHDIVQFAREHKILYQGRGSAANSVVCYCLQITSVDPRQISVLFERFISKERNEPPDIDVDFEHQRREEVMQYIYKKYGRERAALAATVIRFRFKSAFRGVGKALGIEESRLDFYIKGIDRRDRTLSWEEQLTEQGIDDSNRKIALLLALCKELIGFPRHLSQHVGGFVISAGPLSELVPVENASMQDRTVIQWDKDDLETLGLLKVDVLALGMLSAIRRSFDMIRHHYQRVLSIADITAMGDDPAVYADLQKGDSIGVFQVESRAQMSMLPRLKPACYYDLVVQIAIVRPGPIQGDMVHPYLRRRAGEEAVTYPSREVKEVLARTLGVPIFQEQVIKLAMVAAGFSGGEADQLRRAMASWKRSTKLHQFRQKLINGMLERGYDEDFAERVFQQICGFGEYGFPESHAASFAVLAYVSAWIKHYYPEVFYASLLNSLPMGFYSASQLIQDAIRHQVDVLAVDINQSDVNHQLQPRDEKTQSGERRAWSLRLGLRLVRGLSASAAERVISARPEGGYQSMAQLQRLALRQTDLDALASANAFACFSGNRYQARWDLMQSPSYMPLFDQGDESGQAEQRGKSDQQSDCVREDVSPNRTVEFAPPDAWQTLFEDYSSTGLSLNTHPLALLRKQGLLNKDTTANELQYVPHKSYVSVSGLVTGKQSPGTAAGVSFYTLEDETGNINVVIWRTTARAQKQPYLKAQILRVVGILEQEAGVVHVIAGRLEDLGGALANLKMKAREFH